MPSSQNLARALWRIYERPSRPVPWAYGGNLPWDDPAFSARMLAEHLDESHGAASRRTAERTAQLDWLWDKLGLQAGQTVLDVTCGPGLYAVPLAKRGCHVVGVDFGPAALAHARQLAEAEGVGGRCTFRQADIRDLAYEPAQYDAALLLYGQLAVMSKAEAQAVLAAIGRALRPGGRLVLELLDQERVDKKNSSWWFTDTQGLWGNTPFLHLGERQWLAEEQLSLERYHILHLETGEMDEITLCDQTYSTAEMTGMLATAGMGQVAVFAQWDGLPIEDAAEWVVYVAQKADS